MIAARLLLAALLADTGTAATLAILGADTARGGTINITQNGVATNVYAGVILGRYNGGPTIAFYCADLFTPIGVDTYNSRTVFPRAARHEDRAAWLYANRAAAVNSVTLGEAMQMAIWDIIHDNGDGPNAGSVRRSGSTPNAVVNAWTNYLSVSLGQTAFNVSIFLNTVISTGGPAQTLIGALQSDTVADSPEPGTMLLCSTVLLALGWRRKGSTR